MKRITVLCLALCLTLCLPAAVAPAEDARMDIPEGTYQNPIEIEGQYPPNQYTVGEDYGIGDPYILRYDGRYYLYASTNSDSIRFYTSDNLVDWTYGGICAQDKALYYAYAPEVTYWRGAFYMITSPGGNGHYILRSDAPKGPFTFATDNFGRGIDGSLHVMDDGTLVLLYTDSAFIHAVSIDPDTMLPAGETCNLGATLNWWTEAPALIRRGPDTFLTYSGNHLLSTGYRVAYSVARDALGPYTHPWDNTLHLRSNAQDSFTNLGHNTDVYGPDLESLYSAYHNQITPNGPTRRYNLDRLLSNGERLYSTATSHPMPVPSLPDVYARMGQPPHGFAELDGLLLSSRDLGDAFTQEFNFVLAPDVSFLISRAESADGTGSVDTIARIDGSTLRVLSRTGTKETELAVATIPDIGPEGTVHALRVEHTPETTYLEIDGMRLIASPLPIDPGAMGIESAEAGLFTYIAGTAQALGSGDFAAVKPIPGQIAALHAANGADLPTVQTDWLSQRAVTLSGSAAAEYTVSVASDGLHGLDIVSLAQSAPSELRILLDGAEIARCTLTATDAPYRRATACTLSLTAGLHTLSLEGADGDSTLLTLESWNAAEAVTPRDIVFAQKDKRRGFTALGGARLSTKQGLLLFDAGSHGYALLGEEGYTDYAFEATFNLPAEDDPACGLIIRATDVSFHPDQVRESFNGYAVAVSAEGITLLRSRYGYEDARTFVPIPNWADVETATLRITASANAITVSRPGDDAPLILLEDDLGFTHGLAGVFSHGAAFAVHAMSIAPLP